VADAARICPLSSPPDGANGSLEPKRRGIIIRVSGVRVPPPAWEVPANRHFARSMDTRNTFRVSPLRRPGFGGTTWCRACVADICVPRRVPRGVGRDPAEPVIRPPEPQPGKLGLSQAYSALLRGLSRLRLTSLGLTLDPVSDPVDQNCVECRSSLKPLRRVSVRGGTTLAATRCFLVAMAVWGRTLPFLSVEVSRVCRVPTRPRKPRSRPSGSRPICLGRVGSASRRGEASRRRHDPRQLRLAPIATPCARPYGPSPPAETYRLFS
jgi:hypothetical protein